MNEIRPQASYDSFCSVTGRLVDIGIDKSGVIAELANSENPEEFFRRVRNVADRHHKRGHAGAYIEISILPHERKARDYAERRYTEILQHATKSDLYLRTKVVAQPKTPHERMARLLGALALLGALLFMVFFSGQWIIQEEIFDGINPGHPWGAYFITGLFVTGGVATPLAYSRTLSDFIRRRFLKAAFYGSVLLMVAAVLLIWAHHAVNSDLHIYLRSPPDGLAADFDVTLRRAIASIKGYLLVVMLFGEAAATFALDAALQDWHGARPPPKILPNPERAMLDGDLERQNERAMVATRTIARLEGMAAALADDLEMCRQQHQNFAYQFTQDFDASLRAAKQQLFKKGLNDPNDFGGSPA